MRIALDYDDTYTRDAELWDLFIQQARLRGHVVWVVTMRYESESVQVRTPVDGVHYTARKAKKPYMDARGLIVDIWIDDRPFWVLNDATGVTE